MSPFFESRFAVYRSSSRRDCDERVLVLQSADIACDVVREGANFAITVAAAQKDRATAEIDAYEREHREFAREQSRPRLLADGWSGVFGYAVILLGVNALQARQVFQADWFDAGKAVSGLIRDGQWWRAVTALTLHVDSVHLMGNVFFGGLFGLFAGQMLGSGLAWWGILLAGTAGNLVNAWIQPVTRSSVGASTAVFATLGMLCMLAWGERRSHRRRWFRRWSPVIAGVVLLGYTGVGGERTDVSGHVSGFVCGMLVGAACALLGRRVELGFGIQALLGALCFAGLSLCWALALRSAVFSAN